MKKQILGATMSLTLLSITSVLASSDSDDNDSKSSHLSSKKKSRKSTINRGRAKKKESSSQTSENSEDNNVKHDKQKSKGQKTGRSTPPIFTAQSSTEDSSTEDSSTYSIPTTDSPSDTIKIPSGEEILAPKPKVVKKNTGQRVPKHAAAFKEQTGYKSATDYLEANNVDMDAPQIGHAQGYKNHGPIADTRKNNLAVINQTTNLKMNVGDRQYQNGDIDANHFIVEKDTQISIYTIQQLANPSNYSLPLTPAIVLPANMEKLCPEANAELKKKVTRALSPERKKEIKTAQTKNPDNFSTFSENDNKIQRKIEEYKDEGKTGPYVMKFSDQSRSNRNTNDKIEKVKKDKDKKDK